MENGTFYVYFVATDLPGGVLRVKIGMTLDLFSRLRSLQTGSPVRLSLAFALEVPQGANPSEIEQQYHKRFGAKRTHGEWFSLCPSDLATIQSEAANDGVNVLSSLRQARTRDYNPMMLRHGVPMNFKMLSVVHEAMQTAAANNERSLNAEFSWALEQYLLGRYTKSARRTPDAEYITVKMYLTQELHEAIGAAATRETRTFYGQIEFALKQAYLFRS